MYGLLTCIFTLGIFQNTYANTESEHAKTCFVYVPERSKHVPHSSDYATQPFCKLCKAAEKNNVNEFQLLHTPNFTVMLNLFPYGEGHLLIVAKAHIKALDELTVKQRNELIFLISATTTILKTAFKCPGVNVGYNEGKCSGASIIDHLHMHVLPRFEFFEKSFVHALSNMQIVQWNFKEMQQRLQPYFDALNTKTET